MNSFPCSPGEVDQQLHHYFYVLTFSQMIDLDEVDLNYLKHSASLWTDASPQQM